MSMPNAKKGIGKGNNKTHASFSFISMECSIFKEIEKETLKKNRKKVGILLGHLDNWIDPIRALIKSNPDLCRSLIGLRFSETFTDMQLAVFSILSGCYFNAVRTLRFTFESMIHAVYLEMEYPKVFPDITFELLDQPNQEADFQTILEEKLKNEYSLNKEQCRYITGFRSKIIDSLSFLKDVEKDKLKKTYSKLSRFVHPAPEQIKKIVNDPGFIFTFFYDEKFFNECAELTDEVMDATFAIALYKFPDLKQSIKAKENTLLYDSLSRLSITKRLLDA